MKSGPAWWPGGRVAQKALRAPEPRSEAALAAHAETCLARYKQPRLYRHVAALPHTANGKLNRRALRAEWEEKL